MELEFIQNETGKWVAEFQVTSDFNLHLDNVNKRSLKILQKTQGNGYGIVADTLEVRDYTNVYDCDFTGLVYPKFIRIESGEKPYGIITTDGEVTEIKSQSKEVEITANGVTEIAPDAGFGYLSGVKVNVNVPTGGSGGGESGGEEGDMRYIDMRGGQSFLGAVGLQAYLLAGFTKSGMFSVVPAQTNALGMEDVSLDKTLAVALPWNAKIVSRGITMTIAESLEGMPLVFLTEEEFYNPATYA